MSAAESGPVVTIVVACYNHERYVGQSLESVFAQDHPSVDIIVTDDASQDGTQAAVDAILRNHDRAVRTVFHAENRGLCATLNEALALVKTPFVAILSADDWMAPNRISTQLAAMEAAPQDCALVYSDMHIVDAEGGDTGKLYSHLVPINPPDSTGMMGSLFERNYIPAPSVLARTDCLRDVGGYDESLPIEDYDMWLRLARYYSFTFCPEPLIFYRVHGSSMTAMFNSMEPSLSYVHLKILQKHRGVNEDLDRIIQERSMRVAKSAYLAGYPHAEVKDLLWAHWRSSGELRTLAYAIPAQLGIPGLRIRSLRRRVLSDRS
jgi:glycosyltransferase involved in cell wall biosynthesis